MPDWLHRSVSLPLNQLLETANSYTHAHRVAPNSSISIHITPSTLRRAYDLWASSIATPDCLRTTAGHIMHALNFGLILLSIPIRTVILHLANTPYVQIVCIVSSSIWTSTWRIVLLAALVARHLSCDLPKINIHL